MTEKTFLNFIRQADDDDLNELLDAITTRYKTLHPGWEIAFLAMPLDDLSMRQKILEFALKYNGE